MIWRRSRGRAIDAADPPAQWNFEHSSTEKVLVRDVVDEISVIPRHRMLNLQVTCERDELDDDLPGSEEGA